MTEHAGPHGGRREFTLNLCDYKAPPQKLVVGEGQDEGTLPVSVNPWHEKFFLGCFHSMTSKIKC